MVVVRFASHGFRVGEDMQGHMWGDWDVGLDIQGYGSVILDSAVERRGNTCYL